MFLWASPVSKFNSVEGYLCCDALSEVEVSAVEVRRSCFLVYGLEGSKAQRLED